MRIDGAHQLLSVDPDELFGLRFPGTGKASYFMFERDRGEMPVHRRKSKDQTYYAKKMLTYHEANRVGEHVAGARHAELSRCDRDDDAGLGLNR